MDRNQYMDELHTRLEELSERLDEIEEILTNLSTEDENDVEMETVNALRRDLESIKMSADEMEQADEETFDELQATIETDIEELEEGLDEAEDMAKNRAKGEEE